MLRSGGKTGGQATALAPPGGRDQVWPTSVITTRQPLAAGGGEEPPDRLVHRLPAQAEGGVVDGQQVLGAERPEHPPRLLGRGVARDPRVVRADRQDGEIDRAALPVPRQNASV